MIGHTSVYEVVNSSLVGDAVYSVLVEFDTLAGSVSSNTTFGKQMSFESTLKVYKLCISFYPIWKQTYFCCTNCHLYKCQLSLQKHLLHGVSFVYVYIRPKATFLEIRYFKITINTVFSFNRFEQYNSQTVFLYPETYSRPTSNYTDIIATTGAGIMSY